MDILSKIVTHKQQEVARQKAAASLKSLEQRAHFQRATASMKQHILEKSGVIAEIKRKSPSKGVINASVSIEHTSVGYVAAGASGLSILTDTAFFGGSNDDLEEARALNSCPILRKDFMIDEYQVIEAKAIGADVILLIASVLDKKEIVKLGGLAQSLGMEVLLEVHNEHELHTSMTDKVDLIGVNNRNLSTFVTSTEVAKQLVGEIPHDFVKVAESGLHSPDVVRELKQMGYQGFLIGETFMKAAQPERAARDFINQL